MPHGKVRVCYMCPHCHEESSFDVVFSDDNLLETDETIEETLDAKLEQQTMRNRALRNSASIMRKLKEKL